MSTTRLIESAKDAAFEAALDKGMSPKAALIVAEEGETYLPSTDMFHREFLSGPCGLCSEAMDHDNGSARVVVHLGVACWMRLCHRCVGARIVAWDGSSRPAYEVAEEQLAVAVKSGTDRQRAFAMSRLNATRRSINFT